MFVNIPRDVFEISRYLKVVMKVTLEYFITFFIEIVSSNLFVTNDLSIFSVIDGKKLISNYKPGQPCMLISPKLNVF